MKRIPAILTVLGIVLGLAAPAAAQQAMVTVQFRVVANVVCPNATYWGLIGVLDSEFDNIQLADPDGDGVFTGSTQVESGRQFAVMLVQGTGVQQTMLGPAPGRPTVTIRDFGALTLTQDMTFEGSVSSCPAGLPDTGLSDKLPVVPLAGSVLLLTAGIYLRRRMWRHA